MRKPAGLGGPMAVSSSCLSIACIVFVAAIYLIMALYNHHSFDNSERLRYKNELQELRELVKRHESHSLEAEGLIQEQLKSLAETHQKIPSYETAIREREGKDQILDSNITQLQITYSDLRKKIKYLEELIQDLDSKDKEHHSEFHSQKANNLRRDEDVIEKSKIIDELLESLSASESHDQEDGSLSRDKADASAENHFNTINTQATKVNQQLPPLREINKNNIPDALNPISSSRSVSTLLGESTVLLIIASNRPQYLSRTLSYVIKYHPLDSVPIVIVEDGSSPAVERVVSEMKSKFDERKGKVPFVHVKNTANQNQYFENGYWRLCAHFKWALSEVFGNRVLKSLKNNEFINVRNVILLEEDLQIAPDFFEYFAGTKELLEKDNTLMAVSAFNDNGQGDRVKDNKALYRSDFFPGLGWMMTRALWDELSVKWPRGYWDDWLREPSQRKGRHFIRPEICRTYHFGTHGVSQGEFQDGFLNDIKLADTYESFTTMDLSYLEKERWDKEYLSAVARAKTVTFETFSSQSNEVKIFYSGFEGGSESFVRVARWAGVMDNIKANVPRTAYKGIVTSYRSGVKIHIVPRQ